MFLFISSLINGQVTNGLVARYSFNNGNANDDLGRHHAKAYGAALTEDRFGNENFAYYLQGNTDSYITLGSSPDLKLTKATLAIWVKVEAPTYRGIGGHHNPILMTRAHGFEDFCEAFYIGYAYDLGSLNTNNSLSEAKQVSITSTKKTSLGIWHHVAMTYDDNFLCFYMDGMLEGKFVKNFKTKFLEGDSVLVGKRGGHKNVRYLHAAVDDIEIYNRVLTPAEINQLYLAPNPNKIAVFLKWLFIVLFVIGLLLATVWLIRRRIARLVNIEKEKNQLRNNWYEQENKVLTAQMNPHFIFNSLNTIQQFIIINDNEKAQLYLSKFSRLLRMILENNIKDNITLEEEITIIEKYLEIESLRFNNVFSYKLVVGGGIKPEAIHIPRFLIQPFVENALWHGLLPKDGDKQLQVLFEVMNEKTLCCAIEDNGVGRKQEQLGEEGEKNKSLAINFIQQRLQLMAKLYNAAYGLLIIDKTKPTGQSDGTKVIITIPILNN